MNMYVSLHVYFYVYDILCLAEHGLLHLLSRRTTRRPSECRHKCWDNHFVSPYAHSRIQAYIQTHTCTRAHTHM